MPKTFYEFQFTRKSLPYYVDVHAETVTEALMKANHIDHDFTLVPDSNVPIRRLVLKWDGENDSPIFTKEDIIYIYGLDGEGEFGSIDELPEEARK